MKVHLHNRKLPNLSGKEKKFALLIKTIRKFGQEL